jgi:opacity protein-like surface antigen
LKQLASTIIGSLGLLFCIATTAAADHPRPYLSLIGGLNLADEMTLSDRDGDFITTFEPGFFAGGALGYDLGDGFPQIGKGRIELEVGYRYNELHDTQFSTGTLNAAGDLSTLSVMVNTVGEYREYAPTYFPYFGVGIGAAVISMNETSVAGHPLIDDSSVQLAYQLLAGVCLPLGKNLAMDLGYRYFGTLDPEFTDSRNNKVEADLGNHAIEIGLRLRF